jgi:carboxypeptidase T
MAQRDEVTGVPPAGYLTAAGVEACIQWLASTYPQICQLIPLPEASVEGRAIHLLKIGHGSAPGRRGVVFLGGVHARELVPPDCLVSFAFNLCSAYSNGNDLAFGPKVYSNLDVRLVVEVLDLFILPLVNPDGRSYVQTAGGDPWWRKNRSPNVGQPCMGVDINRNYDFLWSSGIGTSANSCSEVFKGPGAFSEPETRNVLSVLDAQPHVVSLMDVHSYSQLVLYPWGDDDNQSTDPMQNFLNPAYDGVRGVPGDTAYQEYLPSDDLQWFANTGSRVRDAIAAVRATVYTLEQGIRLYPTTGTAMDFPYSRHFADPSKRRIYSYTLETGLEFQPPYSEALNIISEVSSGLFQFCMSSLCIVESMVTGTQLDSIVGDLRLFREELVETETGEMYARLVELHSEELLRLLAADTALRARALKTLEDVAKVVESRHGKEPRVFAPELIRTAEELLDDLARAGSRELASTAQRLKPHFAAFHGKTVAEGLRTVRRSEPGPAHPTEH